jgi:hypothetical protein
LDDANRRLLSPEEKDENASELKNARECVQKEQRAIQASEQQLATIDSAFKVHHSLDRTMREFIADFELNLSRAAADAGLLSRVEDAATESEPHKSKPRSVNAGMM